MLDEGGLQFEAGRVVRRMSEAIATDVLIAGLGPAGASAAAAAGPATTWAGATGGSETRMTDSARNSAAGLVFFINSCS